jgi:hypothetical protein
MADQESEEKPLSAQPAYGVWVVVFAIAVIGVAFAGALIKWGSAKDVLSTMGVVIGGVSSLVAAFFGVRAGTYAQAKDVERQKHRDRTRHTQGEDTSEGGRPEP